MDEGNLWKEKKEYFFERFKTKSGLVDFFVGSAVWGFVIVSYSSDLFGFLMDFFSFVGNDHLQYYFAYLALAGFYSVLGLVITFLINKISKEVF